MRAGQPDVSVENEERHPRDAELARSRLRPRYLRGAATGFEPVARRVSVYARFGGQRDQRFARSEVPSVEEVAAEQALDERVGSSVRLRPGDQPVRLAGVRLTHDRIEVEVDAGALAGLAHTRVDLRRAPGAAELRLEVRPAVDAFGRQIRIELEWMPTHDHVAFAAGVGKRDFKMAFADEAPGAHEVGDDVDGQRWVAIAHGRIMRRPARRPIISGMMPAVVRRFDVFCRVVDNFGDAGVAWRLSRQLAAEHAAEVALWIDDLASLARIAPELHEVAGSHPSGVRVVALRDDAPAPAMLPQAVIEAFGCGLPDAYLDAMERAAKPPVWINLEYLSAEAWIEGAHGLPSPQPQRNLTRWFYFPGFTAATGGLLRERDLMRTRETIQADPRSRSFAWESVGLPVPAPDATAVSLFSYPNAATLALLEAWADGDIPIACIVPEGVATAALDRFFGGDVPYAGQTRTAGTLTVAIAPFVDQDAFDRRLWACDLNLVRGEDSFLRAQWAARPLVWHIYPQAERAHAVKLDAFLDRYTADLDAEAARALREFTLAFNDADSGRCAEAWLPLSAALPALRAHAAHWAASLARPDDLATRLVDFCENRL